MKKACGCGCHLKPKVPCECGSKEWEQLWYDTGETARFGVVTAACHEYDRWVCKACREPAPGEAGISHKPSE